MRKSVLPIRLGNETAVDTFVTDIMDELRKSTTAWKRIAEIFASAQEQFGRQSKEMTELGNQTGFTKSKVDKLIQITKDTRINSNLEVFGSVSAWTVLYDVTLLNTKQFDQLNRRIKGGESLTSKLINSIRKPILDKDLKKMQTLATIQMDINAIKSGIADHDDYEKLVRTLQELAIRVPFIRISMNDLVSKDVSIRHKEVQREFYRIVRSKFIQARKNYLRRISSKVGDDYLKIRRKEVMEVTSALMTNQDFKKAFEYIESDQFNEAIFYREAEQNIWKIRDKKFKDRVSNPHENKDLVILNTDKSETL